MDITREKLFYSLLTAKMLKTQSKEKATIPTLLYIQAHEDTIGFLTAVLTARKAQNIHPSCES